MLKTKPRGSTNRTVGKQLQLIPIVTMISLILFGGIGWRLSYLQLEQGEANQLKADKNRTRIVPKPAIRGGIVDRNGKVFAKNNISYSAYLWPEAQQQKKWAKHRGVIAKILSINSADLQNRVKAAQYNYPSLIPIARNLTPEQITALEEYNSEFQWLEIEIDNVRHYPQGELAAQIIGYTGELDQEQLKQKKSEGYRLGDVVGKMGVELAHESKLRGTRGGVKLEVNGAGRVVNLLGEEPAQPGTNIKLTLDANLQQAAEKVLGTRKGAIVMLNPHNGAVLAMASYPRFDPNIFSTAISNEVWQELQANGNPFLNMALRPFAPASTFKIVTATAGMETGKYPANTVLGTYPYLQVGEARFGEWNKAGFGPMGYIPALGWSSNTFFGQIGRGVGGDELIKWARAFGFGASSGIELQEESTGLIADDAWKRLNFKDWGWTTGDTVNMSIGQGFTSATPLQVAVMFSAIANDGHRIIPHLLETENQTKQAERVSLNLNPTTLSTIKQGLRAVVNGGTGNRFNSPYIPPGAGKSGTAEAPPGKSHAWFGAFAPYEKPEVVVVAFAEHSGGGGGKVAAPLVRQAMEAYFLSK